MEIFDPGAKPDPDHEERLRSSAARVEIRPAARTAQLAVRSLACPSCEMPLALSGPVNWHERIGCPFCDSWAPTRSYVRRTGWPQVDLIARLG